MARPDALSFCVATDSVRVNNHHGVTQMTDKPLSRWQKGFNSGVEEAAKALEADAMKCDCAALEERECACGAWCEWKSITSARAIEIVRELKDIPPPEGDGC